MFLRGAVTVALSLTAVSLPILFAAPAWSEQSLANLDCIKIQVSLVETGEPLGTSKEEIRDALARALPHFALGQCSHGVHSSIQTCGMLLLGS